MSSGTRTIGVAVVGFGWMGRAHARAYARVVHHYPQLALVPRLVAIADEAPGRAAEAAERFGASRAVDDWRVLLADDRIEAVSVTAPNHLHREIAEAFAGSGRHVWLEKPAGVTAEDARSIASVVRAAGVRSTVGFSYRTAPAVEAAREVIRSGRIGEVTHASVRLLSDYAADPAGAFTWRYRLDQAGHGVLGDLASHGVDLLRLLVGEIAEVVGDGAVLIPERLRPPAATVGHQRAESGERRRVENEDWAAALVRFRSGARGTLEVSRVAAGAQNDYGVVVHGTRGRVAWDFRRMGELRLAEGAGAQDLAAATVHVGPGAGDYAAFQPAPAIAMSYDDLKVIEAGRFLASIVEGRDLGAGIDDAVRAAEVVDAVARSSVSRRWCAVEQEEVAR